MAPSPALRRASAAAAAAVPMYRRANRTFYADGLAFQAWEVGDKRHLGEKEGGDGGGGLCRVFGPPIRPTPCNLKNVPALRARVTSSRGVTPKRLLYLCSVGGGRVGWFRWFVGRGFVFLYKVLPFSSSSAEARVRSGIRSNLPRFGFLVTPTWSVLSSPGGVVGKAAGRAQGRADQIHKRKIHGFLCRSF